MHARDGSGLLAIFCHWAWRACMRATTAPARDSPGEKPAPRRTSLSTDMEHLWTVASLELSTGGYPLACRACFRAPVARPCVNTIERNALSSGDSGSGSQEPGRGIVTGL